MAAGQFLLSGMHIESLLIRESFIYCFQLLEAVGHNLRELHMSAWTISESSLDLSLCARLSHLRLFFDDLLYNVIGRSVESVFQSIVQAPPRITRLTFDISLGVIGDPTSYEKIGGGALTGRHWMPGLFPSSRARASTSAAELPQTITRGTLCNGQYLMSCSRGHMLAVLFDSQTLHQGGSIKRAYPIRSLSLVYGK